MEIIQNYSLKEHTTLHIKVFAKKAIIIEDKKELKKVFHEISQTNEKFYILGGGSNVLFTKDFDGTIVIIQIKGISIKADTPEFITLNVGAGENWHNFVLYAVENNYGGVENLAYIPGTVGAAPIQNIGAYGVEFDQVCDEVEVFDIKEKIFKTFTKENCKFGYRDSIFKHSGKSYVITNVSIKLSKSPILNLSYKDLQDYITANNIDSTKLSVKDVCLMVIEIRKRKLPDPAKIGTAGSFYKNPIVDKKVTETLLESFPEMPVFSYSEDKVKLSAGWLIDKAGWKGYRKGDAGVYEKHALVLVNYGNTSGKEMADLVDIIIKDVDKKFGLTLEPEVNVV